MEIDKHISYQIENQFPALYKESGAELIALMKSYYDFMETQPNQSTYNNRRIFEYRDIDNTLSEMVVFFQNKYLQNLPSTPENADLILKHIMDLYRRKGTQDGIKIFFQMFYNERAKIYYPSKAMLKVSDSEWTLNRYLQLYPNFTITPTTLYRELLNRKISGTISKSEAVVDNVVFIVVNDTFIPILFINDILGEFVGFDEIYCKVDGVTKNYGKVYGSMVSVEIFDDPLEPGSFENQVGDILFAEGGTGFGGKFVVTKISDDVSGQIEYTIVDGGFGYTRDNTSLLVSNQIVFLPENTDREFRSLDVIYDQFGTEATVINQRLNILGVKTEANSSFSNTSILYDSSNTEIEYERITIKNETSPGELFPDTLDETDVKVNELTNIEFVTLITNVIGNYLDVPLNAANYNLSPALEVMSDVTDPVFIDTPLIDAFIFETFEIGTIVNFKNINPGQDYTNDVFAIAYDPIMYTLINKNDQILKMSTFTSYFAVGEQITQGSKTGVIKRIEDFILYVTPYSYEGFNTDPIRYKGTDFFVDAVSVDYNSEKFGLNAVIDAEAVFVTGKVLEAEIVDSGFGYIDGSTIKLVDDDSMYITKAIVDSRGMGKSEGFWSTFSSHIGQEDGKVIQDSFYVQEYSYEIQSKLNINTFEKPLKETMHLAGSKMFSKFDFESINKNEIKIQSFIEV